MAEMKKGYSKKSSATSKVRDYSALEDFIREIRKDPKWEEKAKKAQEAVRKRQNRKK